MEIAPGVHQIDGIKGANAFLLIGERLALVDTGNSGNAQVIERYLRGLGRSMDELALVVLSHYHSDHIGSAATLRKMYTIEIAAHEAEVPYIDGSLSPPVPPGIVARVFKMAMRFMEAKPVSVDRSLMDGQRLDEWGATVVHTPGHTPGSVCIYMPASRTLLVGDALARWRGRLSLPPGIFTMDKAQTRRSAAKLAELDIERIGFGHGAPLTSGGGETLRKLISSLPDS